MDQEGSNERCHGHSLNFNAPLLSTRRLTATGSIDIDANANPRGIARDISKRIPFSWERSPGMPKDIEKSGLLAESPPPPKLPSGRWRPPAKVACDDDDDDDKLVDDNNDDEDDNSTDCDDDTDTDDDEVLSSDVIDDNFSLSESIDIVDGMNLGVRGLEHEGLEMVESRGNHSPSFIICPFLPAADALASSYSISSKKKMHKRVPSSSADHFSSDDDDDELISDIQVPENRKIYSSPRYTGTIVYTFQGVWACTLLPLRMNHTLCGLKSPIGMARPVPNLMAVSDEHELLRPKEGGGTVDSSFMPKYKSK
ncbi:PREDICTED: uncharacterized protein LOC104593672 [Nelumbo nucifera]|uniref:Uncharacterized protein LOC104593672 n=1 Tax=Nelumbo nucifera TaxID=4432 RepID=A0A1U7ZU82_NELNU|nr:PREDICTED: uncharacterized protein LOC104593672 [Nelumbo nucifera]